MCDGDDRAGYRGWADRLAARIAQVNPDLLYANLAIRGKNTRNVLAEQLEPALALEPDLIAAPLGMNDVIGRIELADVERDLRAIYSRLAESGATVLISTFPNMRDTNPFGRRFEHRLLQINQMMRDFAEEFSFVLADLHAAPVLTDRRSWSQDYLHASPSGHDRFAAGAAYALGLPGSDPDWGARHGDPKSRNALVGVVQDVRWLVVFLTPWLIRKVRGISLGDGRTPKRPDLQPVLGSAFPPL